MSHGPTQVAYLLWPSSLLAIPMWQSSRILWTSVNQTFWIGQPISCSQKGWHALWLHLVQHVCRWWLMIEIKEYQPNPLSCEKLVRQVSWLLKTDGVAAIEKEFQYCRRALLLPPPPSFFQDRCWGFIDLAPKLLVKLFIWSEELVGFVSFEKVFHLK